MQSGGELRRTTLTGAMLPAQVVRRAVAARDVVALWLVEPGTTQAPAPYRPGQVITLAVPAHSGTLYRSYSLSSDGSPDVPWEIIVKRQEAGAVSTFLCDRAVPGMVLSATAPRGTFTLPEPLSADEPLIFIAAGTGIAPCMGMLRTLAAAPQDRRPRAQLHYASRSDADVIYGRELAALASGDGWLAVWHYLAAEGVRLSPRAVLDRAGTLAAAAQWYVCGQEKLQRSMQEALARQSIADERIHTEVFEPEPERRSRSRPLTRGAVVGHVRIVETGALLDVRAEETLLAALERQGQPMPSSCRAGECGICAVQLLAGSVRDTGSALTSEERAEGYVLACTARPRGDVMLAVLGWGETDDGVRRRSARQTATVALRVGMGVAAAAIFGAALNATVHPARTSAVGPSISQPQSTGGQAGTSGFSTAPIHFG
ncbi:MAG TPA: 2Fe-2S iron-sulfur cluster-binding protein, partial [Ktedonobacterales bacterium]|nr:2Fe-2S iron-sulfur cluster-binding protein [Ktedonobacterales bacterium]